MSFTEAEARVTEEMKQYISGEFKITNIRVANYSEICPNENGDRWFKCKFSCITLDEEKGTERKSNSYILVQANDVKDAYDVLEASLTDTVSNYEIPSIAESPILDVFPYFDGQEAAPLNEEVPENYTPVAKVEDAFDTEEETIEEEVEDTTEVEEDSEEETEEVEL
jgi:hypothetical protein